MFFMFRFQHLQTMNQTLQTENQTLKTVVPMFDNHKQTSATTQQPTHDSPSIPPMSTSEQAAATQIIENAIPSLNPSAPLPGHGDGGVSAINPGAPLPQTTPDQPQVAHSDDLPIALRSSAAPASSQLRRGGLNPFPPPPQGMDPPGVPDPQQQYGIGQQFQLPAMGRMAPPPMEYGAASERAYV